MIVSILLPKTIDLALRSSAQGCVKVSRMREHGILLWVAAAPISVVGDAEIKDQAPGAGLVSEVVADCNVAAPLRIACAPCVPAVRKRGLGWKPSSRAPWMHLSELCTCSCCRREHRGQFFCSSI